LFHNVLSMTDKNKQLRYTDFEPPMACVNRVVKAALPDNVMMTKESK